MTTKTATKLQQQQQQQQQQQFYDLIDCTFSRQTGSSLALRNLSKIYFFQQRGNTQIF